ncbi:hypothetical protein ADEAN_000964300 [Angomonas deanei]|uniref:Uncharacterized protein n=1 Tax=Angomonas deanei TaxID=59799 RepID=A0A7G2CT42_9TRYP|nr:hypothetical protein ADEAN_000964300 [Angomonas deanei]
MVKAVIYPYTIPSIKEELKHNHHNNNNHHTIQLKYNAGESNLALSGINVVLHNNNNKNENKSKNINNPFSKNANHNNHQNNNVENMPYSFVIVVSAEVRSSIVVDHQTNAKKYVIASIPFTAENNNNNNNHFVKLDLRFQTEKAKLSYQIFPLSNKKRNRSDENNNSEEKETDDFAIDINVVGAVSSLV